MITTFAPIDAVGMATATVTLPPVRVAAAVGFVTAGGAAAVGAALVFPPPLADDGVGTLGDTAITGALGETTADGTDAAPVPTAFAAVTVNVYVAPLVSPLIVQFVTGVAGATEVTEQVSPVLAVAVYPMIVAPPLLAGAAHDTTTELLPAAPPTPVGRPGTVRGVNTAAETLEAALVPTAFVAVAVNVYEAPFAKPLIVQVRAGVAGATEVVEHVCPVLAVAV